MIRNYNKYNICLSIKQTLLYLNYFHSTRPSDEVPQTYENLPIPDAANHENMQGQGNASNYETLQTQGRDNQAYETLQMQGRGNQAYETLQTQGRDNQAYETLQMQDINKEYETLQTQETDGRLYDKLERTADGN